ncbi:MAG TPA: hydroxymethylpyrimidine/phosphomethylpyrimidine kinase [Fluviicola sp.]|nr:hydroxymethylpyrimidine/phosphomethylpyrimidine kinase [Fluviicola sp.]
MSRKRPYCVSIAGFDPSGGAGLTADCKVFEQLHVQGLSVLTANTIQTEDQYFDTHWMDPKQVTDQLTVLLQRYPVRYFKIGLIENAEVLLAVLHIIHTNVENPFIIWDPILKPTAGGDLSVDRFSEKLSELLHMISCITPNLPEYQLLFGEQRPETTATTVKMLYLKGGHASSPGKDFLYTEGKCYPFNAHSIPKTGKHGTGCVLSAALLAHFALDYPLVKACLKSKRYIEYYLQSNETLLGYHSR